MGFVLFGFVPLFILDGSAHLDSAGFSAYAVNENTGGEIKPLL